MTHVFLALASLALLGMVGVQNYLVPALRQETISSGLTGPLHWGLDASYAILAAVLGVGFWGHGLMEGVAFVAALALLLTAATNTFAGLVDRLTGGKHSLWHSRFTVVVFASALVLEIIGDHGGLWWLTLANVLVPGAIYAWFRYRPTSIGGVVVAASPAAEKAYVTLLCVWLIACGG